jgi:hypothetical protein
MVTAPHFWMAHLVVYSMLDVARHLVITAAFMLVDEVQRSIKTATTESVVMEERIWRVVHFRVTLLPKFVVMVSIKTVTVVT